MFARVTRTQVTLESIDSAIRLLEEQFIPVLRKLDGCILIMYMIDRQTGKGYSIGYWRDEAALRASDAASAQLRTGESVGQVGAQAVDTHAYEVAYTASDVATPAHAMRVTPFHISPDRIDEAIQWSKDRVARVYGQQPGFLNWMTLVDRQTGAGYSLTSWASADAMGAADALVGQSRSSSAAELGIQFEPTERFETVG